MVTLILLGLLLGLMSPARADTHKFTDASGDVVTLNEEFEEVAAPDNTDADALQTTVRHGKSRLVIRVKLRDLHATSRSNGFQLLAYVKSDKGRRFIVLIKFGKSRTLVDVMQGEKSIRCRGATREVSATNDRARLSIPRSCLGRPNWIKVSIATVTYSRDAIFFDDALRSGFGTLGLQKYTPKLKRG